ncbi:abortive infection family protein [Mycolicibacterium poriferae]|uniref:abortive infection family protein n=1 Tax=Mycolicibacterium poriferae TaxID=39694 RepID=UPI00321707A4
MQCSAVQCIFLLATAVNRLRNDAGTGHGRPGPPRKTSELSAAEARLVAHATALVAGALLDKLDGG